MRLAPSTLRRKFALAILCSALLPLVVFSAVNYLQTSAGLHHIENGLLAGSTALVRQDMAQQVADGVRPFAASPGFGEEVSQGDTTRTAVTLRAMVQNLNLVQAQVIDLHGDLLSRFSMLPKPQAIGLSASAASFQIYLDKLWVVAPIPIRSSGRAGRIVGTLLVAGQIDDDFLRSVSQQANTPVSVFVDGRLAASSLRGKERPLQAQAAAGSHHTAAGWTTAYTALRDSRGHDAGLMSVSTPDSAFTAIRSSMHTAAALAMLLAMAAALVAAFLIAHRVTRPLHTLSEAAEAIAGGEMRQHIEVKGNDEVAVMAQAFNSMSERVAQTVDELSDQIQDLSRDLAHLSFVGETLAQSHQVVAELSAVADRVKEMTHSGFCGVHLVDGEAVRDGIYAGTVNGSMLAVEELARWVMVGGESATTADLALDQRISPLARRSATGIASVMVVPVVHQGRSAGAISVGSSGHLGYARDTAAVLSTVASQVATALRHAETFNELERSYFQTVTALTAAIEANDKYTADHGDSIAKLAVLVGRRLGLSERDLRRLEYAALLHDVGKIGVPRHILDKPAALSAEEFAVVAQHTVIGERVVSRIDYLHSLAPIIRAAHERWDGQGYPDGRTGEAIPLMARIVFVCDAYHAMTSDRPYRERLTEEGARRELRRNAGLQFDPAVVDAFLSVVPARDEEWPGTAPVADSPTDAV
jgi:HD-GYP domain-containing protein (c-di-GMP phosphodiesterase class II)